ncbi:MAG: glycosyltransferase family 2 protein [Patescibacteria group bacterium]|jgi:glycosyltransferase involved in cell wall biosynthesis
MKISVVIPAYNEEKRIANCLDSLMSQEEKPDEIIVVDNNSSDKTIGIVKKYKKVILIQEKKQGITPTRNAGFNKASGDIIARCDADTVLPSNWIKNIKNDFYRDTSIVAISMPIRLNSVPVLKHFKMLFYIYMLVPRLLIGVYPMIGPGLAIKKTIWNKVKDDICFEDKNVHEDIDLTLHIRKYGKIYHDGNTVVASSARRIINNPASFFGEYTIRFFKMFYSHRHLV